MRDVPSEPEPPIIEYDMSEDIVRRVFVHVRDYREMVQFAHDTREWMGMVRACLLRIVEQE